MNKTTTRISYCLGILLILLNYSAYAQHVDGSSQSNPIIVPQSLATAYFSYRSDITAKQYWFEVNGSNASQIVPTPTSTNTEVNFNLLSISYSSRQGKIVEIQRRMWLAGNVTDRDSNYYVFPFNPVVELKVCNGKITAKDNSANDPSLVRTYELYYNNTLVESPLTSASDTTRFLSDVQPGLTYEVKIKIFSTPNRPGSNGYVYVGTKTLTIPATPSLSASINTVCAGQEVSLTATGGGSYQWSTGNQTTAQISVYPTISTTYSVSVTQSAGCAAVVKNITINVNANPTVSIDPPGAICAGSIAQLRARGSGGTAGYVYNWSRDNGDQSTFASGSSGEIVNVQPTASTGYRVTITDGNGCESTAQVQVVVNPNPTASIDPIPPTVNAGSNVTLTGRVSGGTSPYQYSWSNNATTSSITITASTTTTYRLTVSDNKSCTSVAEVLVTVSTQPTVTIAPVAQPICAGVATVLQSSVSGGTSPYTYLWSNGATTSNATVSPSVTSTYGLTVTDQQGKKDSTQVQVLVNPKPVPSIQGTQPNCAGQSTVLTASGGNTYLWTDGATAASITVNPAQSTTYHVTVSNTYNCSAVDSFRVIVPAALQLSHSLQNDQDCTPNNVTVVPNPLNAQAPLSYSIQRNGSTTLNPSLSNLTTDTFTLMVTDSNGCTASTLVSINEIAPLRITLSKESEHDCTPGNTRINMSTTGARGALSYRLDGGEPYNFTTYLNIPNGLHTITVQDAFGCVASDTVRIAEDSLLVVAEPVIKHVTCPGGSDGSIALQVHGGTGTYVFNWSNLGSTSSELDHIPAGEYAVTVVDSRNCQTIKRFMSVNEPEFIAADADLLYKHVTCNGGNDGTLEITTPFSGGTPPYTFLWSNGSTTTIASNLSVGQYELTITDARGCRVIWHAAAGISQPSPIELTTAPQYTNQLNCITNTVSIAVAAMGGQGNYAYSLDGNTFQQSGNFTNQSNGTHQLVVKDSANCSQTFNIQVVEHIPFTLGYQLENDQDCTPSNTTIVPLPQNAQGTVSYLLFRGSTINFDPNLNGLSSGAFTLSGRDANGCSAGVSFTINEKIPPLPIRLDTLTVCAGLPATMSVRGAPTSGVTYVWTVPAGANNPGNVASFSATVAGVYSVVMTDTTTGCSISAQGEVRHTPGPDPDLCCSESICAGQSTYLSSNNYTPLSFAWSTGATTRGISVNPVQNTTYTLTVTDAAGCKGTAQVSVQILPKPSVQIDSVPPICSGDTITLRAVVSSGTAPYVYYWGSGSSSSTFKVSPISTSTYTVSITDVNGCMASAQVVVPVRTRPNVELGAEQIVCTGTNATLRADVLNGTAPFTYAWSNGATQSLINVVPGATTTYSVTVSDAIGCKSSDQVTVQVNPRPGLGFGSDTTICAGSSATLSANIIGGTAPFTYNWSNGSSASTLTVNPTSTSTYTLTVTDQKGCLAIGSTTVNVLPRPSVTVGPDRAICVGSSTTLSVSASSAHPPLTYAWSTGASTSNLSISPIATTTYTITVTDSLTCSHSDTIIVVVNTTTAGIGGNSSACVGQNTTLTATGGGTYLWSTGASTASIVVSPSTTTTYTVTVTNQGCLDTATQVLNVSTTNLSLIAPNILNTTDCQTGNIAYEVKYTGSSTPGLEFRMNGGAWQSSTWFTNRSAGSYLIEGRVVTPTCTLSLNSRSGNVTEASGSTVVSSITVLNATDCIHNNAGIRVNLTQNVSADYRLFPSPNWNTSNYFSRQSGRHIVEVRPRNSSVCMERDTIEFDEKTASITSVNITGLDDCIQGNLRIEVAATGTPQSGPLQYRLKNYTSSLTGSWQNNGVFINPPNASTLELVEVKTSSGCIFSSQPFNSGFNYGLSDVDPLDLDITGLTYISGATDCIKGNTRVNITTSTGPGVSVSQWRINGGAWTWSPEFYGLGRDSIFVEVKAYDDVRSCVVGKKLFVNERSIPEITQLVLSQHDDCVLNNAQISTQKTGGEGTISYKLNTGFFGSSPVFSNLGSGNHLVTVRDGNACQDTLSVRISEPSLLAISTSKANEGDCTGGNARITVSATGARGTLSYSINGGTPQASNIFNNLSNGTYTVTAQDGVGCTVSKTVTITESGALIATPFKTGETDCVPGNTSVAINVTGALSTLSYRLNGGTAQASNVFNNLSNGSHTISVQDAGGCSTSTTFTVNEPTPLSLGTPQIQPVKCYGEASGSIGLPVSGGVTPYTISWSNGAQGGFIQHLPAGTYTFTVTDSRGCTLTGTALVPEPPAFNVQLSNFVDVACHNGTTGAISTTITGGMSPYTYRWSNSATTSSIANVAAGNYGLTVTDANGCVATATGSLANPAPLSLSHQVDNDLDCIANNLSITAIASGGRGNYTFSLNGGPPQASGLFTGKTTGTYTLTLQDGAGCSAEPRVVGMITEKLPPPLISIDTVRECVGVAASLSINGASSSGMQYNWTVPNGANNPGNVAQFSTLIAGTYSVVMTDTATGCTRTASGVVVHKALPNAEICCRDTICSGQSATLSSNAGYATYAWNNGATTSSQTVSPASTTTYTLTITGSNGCSATDQEVIVVNANPVANTGTDQIICSGDSLLLTGSASGGTVPYTYTWSTGASNSSITVSPITTTTYTITVTDSLSCQATDQVVVTVNPLPALDLGADRSICAGDSITLSGTVSAGTAPYTYTWSTGANTSSIRVSPGSTTTYTLTVTDSLGCQKVDTVVLRVNPRPVVNAGEDQAICAGETAILEGSVTGGAAPYTYTWSNGANAPATTVSPGLDTIYNLRVVDSLGCKDTAWVNVQVLPLPSVQILGQDSLCFGTQDTLQVQTSGGTQPYTYLWNTGATSSSLLMDTTVSVLYTVEVSDNNTCVTRDSFTLTINPLPVVQVKAADTLRCDNPQVLLAPITASGNLQFQWKTSAGHTLADSSQVWVDSMDTYIVEVVDSVGCSSSDSTRVITYIPQIVQIDSLPSTHCDSANAQIRIHLSNPGAWLYRIDSTQWDTSATFSGLLMGTYAISIASPDTNCIIDTSITIGSREICIEICAGDSILIGKPGLNPWCMKWLPEDGLSNPDSSYTWVKPTNSTIYRLIITDDEGNIVDSLIYKVTLCPQLSVSPDTLNLCEHENPVLIASGGNGVYEWKDGNGNTVGTGSTFSPTVPGIYTVVQVSGGATQTVTAQVIKEIADTDLQIEPAYAVLCSDSLILTAPAGYHSLLWKNGQDSILSTASELIVRQPGLYKLEAETGLSCTGQASVTVTTAPFSITLDQLTDTVDVFDYQKATDFYNNLSGTGRQVLGLLNPEGKNVIVAIDKGCYDCGAVTVEVRDTILPESTNCQKTVRRAWIARNDCGRRSVAIQTLIVNDQKPPSFVDFPQDSMIVACGLSLPDESPRAVDNSGRRVEVSIFDTEKIARGSCDTLVIRHWRALDSCGNDSIRKQYLLIKGSPEGLLGVGNPHPCGTPYQQPQLNQDLRQTLQAEDVIWMYGFPVKIWNVTGGAGTFSGNGLLTLPFQEQAVKVTFANIQVNEDGKVLAGSMQAVRAPNQVTYRCPDPKEVDFCPTYTTRKDSIAAIVRQEANGFKNCLWQEKSPVAGLEIDPTRDPNGFDCHGNHISGKTTNEIGCTQSEMNDSKNDKCYGKIEPWAWLTAKDTLGVITEEGADLAKQVKDSLRLIVTDILADLILELEAEHRIQQIKCAGIRTETRAAFAALGLPDSTYVFGSEGQYIKEGMWRQFAGAPSVLSLSVSREDGMETLEKKHVELYPCDKKQEELKTRHTEAGGLQNEEAKGKLIQWLTDMILRLPKDSVVAFQQNRELFKAWIKRQIAARATQNAQAAFTSNTPSGNASGGFHQLPAPSRGAMREEKENDDAAIAEWQQKVSAQAKARQVRINQSLASGEEFIEGTHRAFYLQDIARQKSASFFPPDGEAKDTGAVLLPIAITKPVGGRNYTILLDNINIDASTGGTLNAYLILPSPSSGKDSVVFQALNIPFTPGGADYNNAKLTLKCEAPMRLNDIAQLKLLAGNQTYIEWDCNGFSKLNLAAEIEFCRNVLVPYDGESLQPAPDSVRLKATLSTYITAWDDFTMGVNFSHPFGLSEEGGFLFRVNDAYIDMSSTKTPEALDFPENYPFSSVGDRNLWKGFYMKQFSVYLPQELDQSRASRTGLSLTDMIIDDAGISVVAAIPGPVVPLEDGNLDGWAFSIDSVLIKILRNKFSGAGFGGLVNIPILSGASGAAISPEDCVRYTAMIEEQGHYTFSVQPATGKKIGMWFADVNIEKSSKVSVTYANHRFEAKAVLNGTIKVNIGGGGDTTEMDTISTSNDSLAVKKTRSKIKIPELRFQQLTVSNTAPYFDPGVWDRPTTSVGVKASFDGFSLGVDSVSVEGGANPGLGFRVHLGIGPENGGFTVEGGFKMKGRLDVSTGRQRWLPDGLEVKRFSVKGTIKKFISVNGFVEHFTNNGKFGNGFWGGLDAKMEFELLKGTRLQAVALFGTTNTPDSTKYFMVDVMGLLPDATPGFIKGFGGGVWNRMSARDTSIVLSAFDGDVTTFPIGQSLSGLKYEPDVSAGLGLKAAMLLSLSEGKFKALVSLNAQFNAEGGLDELSLNGVGTMLKKTTLDGNVDTTDAAIRAGVQLKYSFSEKAFDGLLNVKITVPNALTGGGEAKIHFSDKKWFIHVGTPQNPVRANFQIPLVGNIGAARLYLDMGSELPPPATLPSYFREMGITSAIAASRAGSGGGGGVMFGVGLDIKADFNKLKHLYATMNINLGADLALIDYGNAICSNTGEQIGINGWYATGQVYAYLRASVGLKFKDKQFPIAELAVGAVLQGKLPNPTFARGAVGGSYRILGGLVKGKFNMQFTLGQDCGELQGEDGSEQSLEQNYQIIAALRPDEGAVGVVTTSVPAADFRFPINSTLESFDDDGNPISYLVELDGTPQLIETVTQAAVPAVAILSADSRSLKFKPYDALKDSTRFSFIVKVKYSKNGEIIGRQEKQVTFTTGAAASNISPANISASYPISGMKHFYPGEYASEEEFIELHQGQVDLFKGSNAPKAILIGATGGELWQGAVQYNLASKRISFNFPNEILRPGQCYSIEIRRLAQPETRANDNNGGTSLPPGLLTTLNFCTSNYQTFREKATAFVQGATRTLVGNQIVLTGNTEEFDELETGASYGGKSFVTLETILYTNQWYQTQKELLYKKYSSKWGAGEFQFVPRGRNGAAPDQAVSWGGSKVLQFNVLLELMADFRDFRSQVRDYDTELRSKCKEGQTIQNAPAPTNCNNCCVLPEFLSSLLAIAEPTPPNGSYPLRLSYGVPGKGAGSTANLSIYFGTIINPEARKEESK